MTALHEAVTEVIVGAGVMVMVAVPDLVESCVDVALMGSDPEAGTDDGAV